MTAAPTTSAATKRSGLVGSNPAVTVGGAIVVIMAVIYLVGGKDQGLVTQSVVSGLLLGGVYALISVGLTLIFGVLGIVNFAQGAMLTMAMYIVYALSTAGMPVYLATVLAVPVMFVFGMIVQATLLTKLTISGSHDGPLLVTLGLSLLIINVLLMVFGGRPQSVQAPIDGSLSILGAVASWPRVLAFIGAAMVAVALTAVLKRTPLGLSIRAVASNSEGAKLVGVDIGRVYALTFGIGAACVAVAGGLMTPFTSLTPSVGEQFTILAFVIVVLGGLGSVVGAVVGGLVIGLVQTVGALYLPGTGSLILVFAVFILVLFLKPEGLYGARR
ncbi:branched-chain amino acid ABC transporter permease [Rhodococcus sp. 06-156-3C]|uniref:branched-chain amino acid ABC transporter permease n=1 Tax=Nocardiaceae TaxID=85025 RepID=UPI00068D0D39|nr:MULTISPECIES: branched-chain amino acid ABC transporter permease [Rhodococcus]OZD11170.1 branched-chain amino acid ABC transporter permease [Rhodococcus sp. 06-156-4C]OZD14586.1 branched-chain amino acid ABC transporter permease [Rhodococcus sp. 06-156-4a]OZD24920.1 branched-chain amino acid ABC transporter permease [Rhodococcus sp. 06-156-3C]OZD27894.1 branched-chain amino acid ABC transporter permease [Rhodococcus sp. 06-156-3b]OZD39876.1 branched-chain amino acid ABC transporter permease